MAKPKFDEDEEPTPKPNKSLKIDEDEDDIRPSKPVVDEDEDDMDCEFGDEKIMKKVYPFDRIRPKDHEAVRFAVYPGMKPKKANIHYIDGEGGGNYRCLSSDEGTAVCCQKLGDPDLKIAVAVVHYVNADPATGKYGKDVTETVVAVKHVILSRTNFSDISKCIQEDETVDNFDIVMTKKTNGIGYDFNRISKEARWKKNPTVVAQVEAGFEKYKDGKELAKKLGKKLTVLEFKALLSKSAGDSSDDDDDEL